MVFLAASRGELRDESFMSDDAFAVTPTAAQAPQPNEAVYQALHAALSATSRGRWFLSEFLRRNRNSESSKMLDAVARIEQAVATRPAVAAASPDLQIARNWAIAARAEAAGALNGSARAAALTGAERGIRIIREIATSMRAVGNDPRICQILDIQLDAIEAAHRAADQPTAAVLAAFDRMIAQLDELLPAPPPVQEIAPEPKSLAAPASDPEARIAAVADLAAACATGDPKVELTPDSAGHDLSAEQAAEDEALLAVIAAEMGAPDSTNGPAESKATLAPPEPEIFAIPAKPNTPAPALLPPDAPAVPAPAEETHDTPSLGAALLAQGVLTDSLKPARDPFADLKRLTQAEKVALFT